MGDTVKRRAMARDLSVLINLNAALSATSLRGSLDSALDILREATGAEAAEVFLAEPGGRGMVLASFSGPFKNAFFQISRFKPGEGFPGLVLAYKEPIITRALPEDPRYLRTRVKEKGFHSYLCVPLYGPRSVMGSINVAFYRPDADLEGAQALLSWASTPLSMRLQAGVLQLREAVNTYQDTDDGPENHFSGMLSEILRGMVGLSGAQGGILNLFHPGGRALIWRGKEGYIPPGSCPALQADPSQGCPALAEVHGLALYGERRFWPLSCQHAPRLGSVTYCVPMAVGREIIGLVQLAYQEHGPQPPTRDLAVLEWIAEGAAWRVRDAWGYLEGRRRTEAVFHQLGQMETSFSSPNGVPASPETTMAQRGDSYTATSPYLDIRCFGPFELFCQGSLVTPDMVRRRKALTLLKILLTAEGRPLSKETLIEFLWHEVEPEAGAGRLHVVVHALRRLVEPPGREDKWLFIQNDGDRYWFNMKASCRIDVKEFKALVNIGKRMELKGEAESAISAYEGAVQLYRGDFLEDEPFAEWCWAEKEELRETCLDAVKRLANLCAENGDCERGAKHLRYALRIDPSREETHRELMRCLWASGRRDEALRQYEVCKELLQRELGVDPLPETEQLAQRIRSSPEP